jgi:zinc-binding alcohol dehydrogenase/oxidoreductase
VTIRKGQQWGTIGPVPSDVVVVDDDPSLHQLVQKVRTRGDVLPPVGLRSPGTSPESPGQYEWGEVPTPEPGPDEVRVRVRASALNHMDLWLTTGLPKPPRLPTYRATTWPVWSMTVGEGVRPGVGDEVVVNTAWCPTPRSHGDSTRCSIRTCGCSASTAGAATASSAWCLPTTSNAARGTDLGRGAAYPVCATTAWRMLRRARIDRRGHRAGDRHRGRRRHGRDDRSPSRRARVFVTVRDESKRCRAIELGADDAFDSAGSRTR